MRTERQRSAGGVVVRTAATGGDEEEILLIALKGGRRWQLPKGHVEDGETSAETAVREVREETGVTGHPRGELPSIDYWFIEDGKRIHKRVDFFLLDYVRGSNADHDPREVSFARWFPWSEALRRLTFDNERQVAHAAQEMWRRQPAGKEDS
jgi:8-oxo-dGTP pyrophosphatase MutT (NUDIX family)